MTALFVSVFIWGLVAFMATDDYCRTHQKNALTFFVVVGVTLTAIGLWRFEIHHLRQTSFREWMFVGLYPAILLHLRLKTKLLKKQSEAEGRPLSLLDLNLGAIQENRLVRQYRMLNAIMWGYAAVVLIVYFWSEGGG